MPVKRSTTRKTTARGSAKKSATTKKTAATKKTTAKKAATTKQTTKSATKKSTVKKTTTKKTTTKKTTAKKAAPKKTAVKKKAAPKKPAAKKTTTKKTVAKKTATVKKTPTKRVSTKKVVTTKSQTTTKKPSVADVSAEKAVSVARLRNRPIAVGPVDFTPYKSKRGEEYMNDKQLVHFTAILMQWKRELMNEVDRTMTHLKDDVVNYADPNDRATQEEEFSLELRTRDRERKLIKKIDEALERIQEEDYGYCESCGVEIGIGRLEARPTATLCIDCKTLEEIREKQIAG